MNLSVLKFRVFEEVDLVPENNLMQLYQIVRGFRLNENSLSSNLILPDEEGKLQGLGIPLSARSRITAAELISEEREERIFPRSQAPAWERICARSPGFGSSPVTGSRGFPGKCVPKLGLGNER